MSTQFTTLPQSNTGTGIGASGRTGWNRQGNGGGGRPRDDEEENQEDSKPACHWTTLRMKIELADELELFWLDGFGDPTRASLLEPEPAPREEQLLDYGKALKLATPATGPNGIQLDLGSLTLQSQLAEPSANTNGTCSDDKAYLRLQQMTCASKHKVCSSLPGTPAS